MMPVEYSTFLRGGGLICATPLPGNGLYALYIATVTGIMVPSVA